MAGGADFVAHLLLVSEPLTGKPWQAKHRLVHWLNYVEVTVWITFSESLLPALNASKSVILNHDILCLFHTWIVLWNIKTSYQFDEQKGILNFLPSSFFFFFLQHFTAECPSAWSPTHSHVEHIKRKGNKSTDKIRDPLDNELFAQL